MNVWVLQALYVMVLLNTITEIDELILIYGQLLKRAK